MQSIRQAFAKRDIPVESLEIVMSSLSQSTIKQYGSALKLWHDFCQRRNIEFLNTEPKFVLSFLTERFYAGASYGTLNSCRSAISLIAKDKVGEHTSITRFMKGVFKLRPTRPKYDTTWDVSIVLKYLENLDVSSLENLTYKTIVLLALSTAQRAQTLSKININNIKILQNGLEIMIPEILKTSGPGRFQPCLKLPIFSNKPKVCVASTIKLYLEKTESLRKDNNQLFIAIKKPHNEISTQTISRWIKKCLKNSGIDTSVFTAHSTRHAATSAALSKGIDLDTIRRTAGWSEQSQVFANFYNRPIVTNTREFTRSVLQEE